MQSKYPGTIWLVVLCKVMMIYMFMMGSCAGQAKKSNHRGDKVFGALLFYGML
jgi:hypothetical protein